MRARMPSTATWPFCAASPSGERPVPALTGPPPRPVSAFLRGVALQQTELHRCAREEEAHLRLPQGVNLVDANPSGFEITVQSLVEREVMIKPQVIGRLPDGLQVASIEVNPPRIKILYSSEAGGDDEIFIMTTPIYLQNISDNTKLLCNLIAPPDIYPIDKQLPDVVVSITIKPAR